MRQRPVIGDQFSPAYHAVFVLLSGDVLAPFVVTHACLPPDLRASVPVVLLVDGVRLVALVQQQ